MSYKPVVPMDILPPPLKRDITIKEFQEYLELANSCVTFEREYSRHSFTGNHDKLDCYYMDDITDIATDDDEDLHYTITAQGNNIHIDFSRPIKEKETITITHIKPADQFTTLTDKKWIEERIIDSLIRLLFKVCYKQEPPVKNK